LKTDRPISRREARLSLVPIHARVALVALACGAATVHATEGGNSDYSLGVETQFTGIMSAPGLHEYVFVTHYEASHSKDNNGNDNPKLAYFDSMVNAVAERLVYVWPGVTFLGANVETRLALAVPDIHVSVGIQRPTPPGPLDLGGKTVGVVDPSLFPLILGWHSPTFHQTVGAEFIFPIGQYDSSERVNAGRNYFAVAPAYAFTWFPQKGWDISGKLRYEFNGKNKSTDYTSGDEASLEMGSNYQFHQNMMVGLAGYIYQQTTDDRQHEAIVNGNGNKGRVNALGPSFTYAFSPKTALVLKVEQEFGARNKTEGTRYFIQFKTPLTD
jgi:hypothetical protein